MQTPSAEELVAELRGDDPRPLMIVRNSADEKIDALLQAALASERFQLASQWFHCVRVDVEDVANSHYQKLFDGRNPAHLVLSTWDGTKRVEMLGRVGHKVTWSKIQSVLKAEYKKNPYTAIKGLEKLLNSFDALDKRESELSAQLARCKESGKDDQCKKIEGQLAELAEERKQLLAEEQELEDLELRRAEKDAKPAD